MTPWYPMVLIALGALAPWLRRATGRATGWLLAAVPAAIAVRFLIDPATSGGPARLEGWTWVEGFAVDLATRVDGLSGTFAILIAGIGAGVLVYTEGYLAGDRRIARTQGLLLAFMGAMVGLVLSDDVISMFVYWEATSICSFFLIGTDHASKGARNAALQALLVTGGGGLALLAGLVLLRIAAVDLGIDPSEAGRISALAGLDLASHPAYLAILALVAAGAFTKSAQVPFHFWLPSAMAAPTPVSAYLHSATMVKAGVFLLARMHPVLGGTDAWHFLITPFGAVTMLVGAAMAIAQTDLKKVLAYSTVAVLGTLVMLLGTGTDVAIRAAVVFLVAHALYKAALFLVAGSLDHETGTRDATVLGGLARAMPWTAAAGVAAALSQAGAPPLFGFLGKELLYKAKLDLDSAAAWLIVAAVAANVLLVATALIVGVAPFFARRRGPLPRDAHEAPWSMRLAPLALAAAGISIGLAPGLFDRTQGAAMANAIAGRAIGMDLELWHGLSPSSLAVLGLSALTLVLGVAVYRRWQEQAPRLVAVARRAGRFGPEAGYAAGLDGLFAVAGTVADRLQSGHLRRYLLIAVGTAVALAGPFLVPAAWTAIGAVDGGAIPPHEWLLAAVVVGGAIATARTRSRLTAVAALGACGLAVAILFALYSAPDLAMTLIAVETLSVILFVMLFRALPRRGRTAPGPWRWISLAVAGAAGGLAAALTLAIASGSLDPATARYFAEASVAEAFGRNVVNVILVDFRALDTLGEISVVAAAGVGVWALLRLRPRTDPGGTT